MKFSTLQIKSYLGLLAICVCLGCAAGEDFESVPVSGTVTMDGKPFAGVKVSFFPEPTEATSVRPFSVGVTDSDGKFELKTRYGEQGAVVGKHRVSFKLEGLVEETASPDASVEEAATPDGDAVVDASLDQMKMPKRYTDARSEVYFDVPADGADALFELTSEE